VPRFLLSALLFSALLGTASAATSPATPSLDLSRHAGRVVIVDFWASWCKPCRQSIPWLNAMRARYGSQGLTIIGVNVDAERHDADRFLRDVPIEFESVFDPNGDLASQFKVQGMPSSFVFDRTGKLVQTHLGFRDAKTAENEAALADLLRQPVK
jgi:cytochrome c biogenesis protein CcmG, thiol:disulfide interchange protein DsbE